MKKWTRAQWTGALISCILIGITLFAMVVLVWPEEDERDPYQLIFIPKTIDPSNDFWTALIEGAELGAEELGAEIEVFGADAEEDVDEQIELIYSCIEKRPDALMIAPADYSRTTEALRKVKESGIKLILLDSVIDQNIADAVVCTDNYLAGKELGQYTQKLVEEDSTIGIVAHVQGTSTAVERENGIRDGLGEYEEKIVDVVFCNSSYEKAYEVTKEMLNQYPEMDMLIGTNEYAAVGAARAVQDMGMTEQIRMVGFDSSIEEIQYLEAGIFQAIVIQKPFNMGYLGVEAAINTITNREVEHNVDSGSKLITRDNLYEEENQRLLYPFAGQ